MNTKLSEVVIAKSNRELESARDNLPPDIQIDYAETLDDFKLALSRGAKLIRDADDYPVLDMKCTDGHVDIVKYILQQPEITTISVNAFLNAVVYAQKDILDLIINDDRLVFDSVTASYLLYILGDEKDEISIHNVEIASNLISYPKFFNLLTEKNIIDYLSCKLPQP